MIDDQPRVEREFGRLFTGQGNLVLAAVGDDQEAVVAAAEELRLAGAGPVPVDLFDPLGPAWLPKERIPIRRPQARQASRAERSRASAWALQVR